MVNEPTRRAGSGPAVAMVVRNPVSHDARVLRSAHALLDAGYDVTLVGLLRPGYEAEEVRDGLRIVRVTAKSPAFLVLDAIIRAPFRWAYRAKIRHAWLVRRGRSVVARLRRQWWLLGERGTLMGTVAAYGQSMRAARTASVATVLLPAALVRALLRRPPRPEPVTTPRDIPPSRVVSVLNIFAASVRWIFITPWRIAYAWAAQTQGARAMAAVRPAVYHCHDIHTIWTGFIASRVHRAPVIYDAHEIYAHQHLLELTRRRKVLVTVAEWVALRRCAASITVNDSLADWYAARYRVARPTVVRNIPDPRRVVAEVEVPPALDGTQPTLLYIGGITSGRGLDASIEAMVHLPGVRLALLGPAGSVPTMAAFHARIARLGLTDRVHVLGAVPPEAVSALASRATIGLVLIENVCLSYYYSLPNKLFECIHAGLPVIASDFPEIQRIVSAHHLGLTCDPTDPKAIAAAAATLLGDRALYERAVAGAAAASVEYRWEHEAERLLEVYARLAPLAPSAA